MQIDFSVYSINFYNVIIIKVFLFRIEGDVQKFFVIFGRKLLLLIVIVVFQGLDDYIVFFKKYVVVFCSKLFCCLRMVYVR